MDIKNTVKQLNMKMRLYPEGSDFGEVSDGYHTFNELYDHRIRLYIMLCKALAALNKEDNPVWMTWKQCNNKLMKGWFILGINQEAGEQITYHIQDKYWREVRKFAVMVAKAPRFDNHTSADVLRRLSRM